MVKNDKYEVVIGLEVHVQLLTRSKLFSGDSASFGSAPNTHTSPIALAHPGTLPRMNKKAIEFAIKLGLALHCEIEQQNYFARKNYFYPDLPKGYQVSQHTTPICKKGLIKIKVNGSERNIKLNRIHIEEDAGKSLHDVDENYTAIDLNRAGVPLLEIVSEPDLHSSDEAFAYITELRRLVRWLDICDGNMEEGSMRCDANISIRPKGEEKLGTRVEVKNLNSIRNVKKAIDLEVNRLIDVVEGGSTVIQETRSFDADNNITFSLRNKEDADDYRYFPDPDLTPLISLSLANIIGNQYTTITVPPGASLPNQSPLFITRYNALAASILAGPYGLTLADLQFVFNAASKTMNVNAIVYQGTVGPFLCQYNYIYTVDNAGIFDFTKVSQNGNAALIANNMNLILSYIENDRFSLDGLSSSVGFLGQFSSKETPAFYFRGNLY